MNRVVLEETPTVGRIQGWRGDGYFITLDWERLNRVGARPLTVEVTIKGLWELADSETESAEMVAEAPSTPPKGPLGVFGKIADELKEARKAGKLIHEYTPEYLESLINSNEPMRKTPAREALRYALGIFADRYLCAHVTDEFITWRALLRSFTAYLSNRAESWEKWVIEIGQVLPREEGEE